MKTFEERYTAWIDGELTGDPLTAFERELERRAVAGDSRAESDKAGAVQLRTLLREHLQAPALSNAEFFTHQMHERIDAEIDRAARRRVAAAEAGWRFPALAWPFARLVGAGAACLFVAAALYYGLVPSHDPGASQTVAVNDTTSASGAKVAAADVPSSVPAAGDSAPAKSKNDGNYASLTSPTPTPVDDDLRVITPPTPTAQATTLRFDNSNVLWVTGWPDLPNISGTPSSAPAGNPAPAPAPTASTAPGSVP